jgi:hypothetical protein
VPNGYYLARIESIERSSKPGGSGHHFHTVVWEIESPKEYKTRWIWDRVSESPSAAFRFRQMFDATGYTYDSDTDELIGEVAVLEVSQSVIERGDRKGELGNDVDRILESNDETMKLVAG